MIAAAWVGVFRMGLQTLLLVPAMGLPVLPNLKNAAIQKAWCRIKPLLLGTAYYKTDPLIDRILLSTASSGSLSLYYFAQQMYGAASQILSKAIASPLVPALSVLHKSGEGAGFRRVYHQKLLQVGVICLSSLLVLGLVGQTLLARLVGYGNVSASNVVDIWWTMVWLGGMFLGGAMGQICSSSFYASGDTKTPTHLSIATYTAYIPCKLLAFYFWNVQGLAIITSIYYLTNFVFQVYFLEKKSYEYT